MAYDLGLAARIRSALAGRGGAVEKEMFGGIAFMIRGHMSCGVIQSSLMVRLDPETADALLSEKGARPMDFAKRPMAGFLYVDPPGLAGRALRKWVDRAADYAESRPPRKAGAKKARTKAPRRTKKR
jgi:TfoX/Sxy family transcriptional regulator of competence genes